MPTGIHLAEHRDPPGAIECHTLGELTRLGAPHATPRCRKLPVRSKDASWPVTVERIRALFRYHWYLKNITAAISSRSLDFSFRECLFLISGGSRVANGCEGTHPLSKPRPCLCVWQSLKGSRSIRREGHAGLADKPTQHLGTRRPVVRGCSLVHHREVARVQRNALKGRTRTQQRGVHRSRCVVHDDPTHAIAMRPRWVFCRWEPPRGQRLPLATYGLSTSTSCGSQGPVASFPGPSCFALANAHSDLHGAVHT